jgi:hypothetical protein
VLSSIVSNSEAVLSLSDAYLWLVSCVTLTRALACFSFSIYLRTCGMCHLKSSSRMLFFLHICVLVASVTLKLELQHNMQKPNDVASESEKRQLEVNLIS